MMLWIFTLADIRKLNIVPRYIDIYDLYQYIKSCICTNYLYVYVQMKTMTQ